ncbi:MFS transporter [Sphingomonas histidinilytica]|jgi:POT family proton-dependent oligopeptide transporter|uniref:Proton-dependent oligopeptide transporter, POT family n=1 Tax=Rhizorhabdus histidinilytica TaxID=439228 RepID=A0A1T4ZYQ4_9SPHN|nr:peptide MFS transporter [Rhizorhabdus histidinilytica]MBO9375990.1 MFS transporter [Rhizorhabdus histidinilytica]QEH78496.1 peptide MFS transporter [Sphingomonas sp. C8-2]SKB27725.1 proton-dependent oligopeptide transporter, POT family [Rhizorhabdus histidinilytica]
MVNPDADATTEPASPHVSRSDGDTWFGHPRQLARLFSTEAMERFGYYGMRALLTLYLTQHFLFSDQTTNGLYGGFTALVYLTPLVGGLLADRYLGSKKSVKFGAILMSIAYFTLCFGGQTARPYAMIDGSRYEVVIDDAKQQYVVDGGQKLAIKGQEDGSVALVAPDGSVARTVAKGGFKADADRDPFYTGLMLVALSLLTVGNGFFKPNISTIVGALYEKGDRRRDAGFTIFYMGINLGSLFSQILCPFLAVALGWWAGFGLAAIGMLISWALIQFAGDKLAGYGEPPEGQTKDRSLLIYIGALAVVPIGWFLFINLMASPAPEAGAGIVGYLLGLPIMGKVLFATFLASVILIPLWALKAGNRVEFQMMIAAIVMIVFNVVFWTLFEQAGSSLTLFADRNTDLSVFGLFTMSAGQTQFFNAFFIVVLAPLTSILWGALGRRGLEPSIPVKFAIALAGVGLGFLALVWGTQYAGADFKVSVWWLALLYLIHSMAELCISPVGLSMITKLSIARVVGLMMGLWFLSISCAQYVAGIVAQVASVETVGGQVTNLKVSLETYAGVFQTIGLASVAIGAILLVLSPVIKKWMHGVQ